MNQSEAITQYALLVAFGYFAQQIGFIQRLMQLVLHQKQYQHSPQTKVIEFLVATLAGLGYLKEISRSAHPLDQDVVLAQAWGQAAWADYSGVSRTLKALTSQEADQIIDVLNASSQVFITKEVNLALWLDGRLVYDGDLTGLAVSKSSQTYPGVAFGHMDDQICLGYQAAVVSMRSPTYQRLWLSVEHHPGNLVSALAAEEMIQAAEARTGVRPWRRIDLLEQRIQAASAKEPFLQRQLIGRQERVAKAIQTLEQVDQQLALWQTCLAELEQDYQTRQRCERPTSRLAQVRHKLVILQKRRERRIKTLNKAQKLASRTEELVLGQQADLRHLRERLARFQQENANNPRPVQAVFRLDAGFGTFENLALLIEMGYEVYTKLQSWKVLDGLLKQVPPDAEWSQVGAQATMFAWDQHAIEKFCYPLDVGLERFTGDNRIKLCALLHFGQTPVTQDLQTWFSFYSARQTIEAGIKEGKHIFHLNRLKVRSEPAIRLQENFVLFAANFIRWVNTWLAGAPSRESSLHVESLSIKELVQVAAHTSAKVDWYSEVKLLRFSEQSVFAGKELKLPIFAHQLPLPLGKSFVFSSV